MVIPAIDVIDERAKRLPPRSVGTNVRPRGVNMTGFTGAFSLGFVERVVVVLPVSKTHGDHSCHAPLSSQ